MTGRRLLVSSMIAALSLVVSGISPATASTRSESSRADAPKQRDVQVAFLGGPAEVGQVIARVDIPSMHGSEEPDLELHVVGSSEASIETTLPPDRYDRLAVFWDWKSRRVALRKGYWLNGQGHNERKLRGKHNLHLNPTRGAVQYAYWENSGGGTSIWYQATIALVECEWFGCRIVETEQIRVLIDHRKLSDGDTFGAVTGYCDGKTFCPSWVNQDGVY